MKFLVLVVGLVELGEIFDELVVDYVKCVKWVVESGVDFVEVNYFCFNVCFFDG